MLLLHSFPPEPASAIRVFLYHSGASIEDFRDHVHPKLCVAVVARSNTEVNCRECDSLD